MKRLLSSALIILISFTILSSCGEKATTYNYKTSEILDSIKSAMGESYLPNSPIDETMLKEQFGVKMEDIEEFSAEMPMIGFHPDRVIIVKAKSGKGESIETAFKAAREEMITQGMMYPANISKTNAAQVVRHGDYVALLLLGAPDEGSETDEAAKAFAEKEVKVALDAYNAFFTK